MDNRVMEPIWERVVICHFCEDIRQELADQISIIGVFPEKIFVPALPLVFPKFGFYGVLRTPTLSFPKMISIRLEASWRNEHLFQLDVDGASEEATKKLLSQRGDSFGFTMAHIFTQVQVPTEGQIRLVMSVDGDELIAGSLTIALAPSPA